MSGLYAGEIKTNRDIIQLMRKIHPELLECFARILKSGNISDLGVVEDTEESRLLDEAIVFTDIKNNIRDSNLQPAAKHRLLTGVIAESSRELLRYRIK